MTKVVFVILNGVKNLQPAKHKKSSNTAKRCSYVADPSLHSACLPVVRDDKMLNRLSF